jgi:hypothetical protein
VGRSSLPAGPLVILIMMLLPASLLAGTFPLNTVVDMTPTEPLANPVPGSYSSRYLSGVGLGEVFTIVFEDRNESSRIKVNSTTTGATGLAAANIASNVFDTHFVVKDMPITLTFAPQSSCGTAPQQVSFQYRAWGSVGNNPDHHFYVSDDLSCWTYVSTFTIPNAASFTNARGQVYYGFHDVILINGTYYAWGESNAGQTMMVRSANGDDVWEAFAAIGGTQAADGPLQMPESPTPSGSFFDLGLDRGVGKIHVRGNDSAFLLAVNTLAAMSLPPADLEAAFIDPGNWTWHDGNTGLPVSPILEADVHDLREAWLVPPIDPADNEWVIMYTGDYGAPYGKSLGYAQVIAVPVELQSFTIE